MKRESLSERLAGIAVSRPAEIAPDAAAPIEPSDRIVLDADLAAIEDSRRALDILAVSGHLPPASFEPPVTIEERRLHAVRARLITELTRDGDTTRIPQISDEAAGDALRKFFESRLDRELLSERAMLSSAEKASFLVALVDEVQGCGPLEPLLRDPEVSEIMVNKPRVVWVERRGRLTLTEVRFFDDAHMMNVLSRIVGRLGRALDLAHPHVDARLPDGSRVHAIIPPLAVDGPSLTIRKFKKESLQIEDLIRFDAMTPDMAFFLGASVKARLNILVGGGTGTGKTTILNVLSTLVPAGQRIVTIEDAAELKVHQSHPHVVRLESRPTNITGKGSITIRDLVRDSLRMRPDRIIVGECRGGEALDMLQAMNTGHDGSMTTAHANSSIELLQRIETMCLMAGLEIPAVALRRQIVAALDLVVHLKRYADGSRRVAEICEVAGIEGDAIRLHTLFRFEVTGRGADGRVQGRFVTGARRPAFLHKFEAEGLKFPQEIFGEGGSGDPAS